ncbi:MAG: hypothetical protein K8R59_06085 [Thermoanaerobaculales bacterium]|nr:hypothetical protein [Thermoanaerobaculales bacterium]
MTVDHHNSFWLHALRLVRWPAVAVLILLFMWLALVRLVRVGQETIRESSQTAAAALTQLSEGFRSTTITETFRASIPHMVENGLLLEVAALEATETIEREDERWAFFDLVPLGKTISEIRVPVTYRYHLSLEDPWHLEVREGVCFVRAPKIMPTLPPAIHTDGLEKRIESSWLRFDGEEMMADLEKSLTPRLEARAGTADRIDLIRETCRRKVELFVRNWLLAEDQWGGGRIVAVEVLFADEAESVYFSDPSSL